MKELLIKQPYCVTKSSRKLNIHEERVFKVLMLNIQSDLKEEFVSSMDDFTLKIPAKSFIPNGSKNYVYLHEALKSIRLKSINLKLKNGDKIFTGLILQSFFSKKKDLIEITISRYLMPFLINLKNGYTQFLFKTAFELSSAYSIRLYELFSHWIKGKDGISKIFLFVKDVQDTFKLPESYKRASTIEQKVLHPAMSELKSKADVWGEIEKKIIDGRKIIGWEIKIHQKQFAETNNQKTDFDEYRLKLFTVLCKKFRLSPQQAHRVVKANLKTIQGDLNDIHMMNRDGKIRNLGGYTASFFEKKYNLGILSKG